MRAGGSFEASVTVTNRGAVRAIETVQLYVTAVGSRVERAPRDLRCFAQVELAPGASARVTLPVRVDDLAYWDTSTSAWVLEPIAYDVVLAHDAAAEGLRATVRAE